MTTVLINQTWFAGLTRPGGDVADFMDRVIEVARVTADARVPVDTGFLRASAHVEKDDDGERRLQYDADYAIYQEMGTRYMAAQPYLRPGLAAAIQAANH